MKKTWSILLAIGAFIGLAGSIWAASSYWHGYCTSETIHEHDQDESITIAMQQSTMVVLQQRLQWLEQQIIWLEQTHGCPNCVGTAKKNYDRYRKEAEHIEEKIQKLKD